MEKLTEKIKKGIATGMALGTMFLYSCGGGSSGSSAPPNDPPTETTYTANPTANTIYARGDNGTLFTYKMTKKGTTDTFDITASNGSKLDGLLIGDSGKTLPITNTTGNTYKVGTLSLSDLANGTYSLKTPSGKEIGYSLKKGVLDNGTVCEAGKVATDYGTPGIFNTEQKNWTCDVGTTAIDANSDGIFDGCM